MAFKFKLLTGVTGQTIKATVQRRSDGLWWDDTNSQYQASEPAYADKAVALSEGSSEYVGYYSGTPSASLGTGLLDIFYHDSGDSESILATQTIELESGSEVSQTTVSAVQVIEENTHFASGRRSDSIIEVNQNFAGTLCMKPDLEDGSTIATVDSVSITGAATVTATNLRKTINQKSALYDVPALSTTGTYTVVVTVSTVDGQTIPTTGTLIVY